MPILKQPSMSQSTDAKIADLRAQLETVKTARDKHKEKLTELPRAQALLAAAEAALYELFVPHVRPHFATNLPSGELATHIGYRGNVLEAPGDRWLLSGYTTTIEMRNLLRDHLPEFDFSQMRTVLDLRLWFCADHSLLACAQSISGSSRLRHRRRSHRVAE